ncbi:MAG: hypothetical protein ACUVTD_05710 [Nitrososphaerales archaeon]
MAKKNKTRNLSRLRRPPPFTVDNELKMIGMGITLGEGYPICKEGKKLGIRVKMCDKKAIEMVAKSWGTAMFMAKEKRPQCRPTPDNPEGHPYATEAVAPRAGMIMKEYELYIKGTDLERKWKDMKKRCPKKED